MPRITICPRCTSHLGLPADIDPIAQVQCPICEVEFSLATVVPRELPQARILEHEQHDASASTTQELSPQERLSQLIRSTAQPSDSNEPEPNRTESYDDAYQDADPEFAKAPQTQPSHDELPLGSSRLDQLLSDLTKTPTPVWSMPPDAFEPKSVEVDSPLANDFDAEVDDENRPPAGAEISQASEVTYEAKTADADLAESDQPEEVAVPSLGSEPQNEQLPGDLRTTPRRKRRRSAVRTLVGIVGGGALGILLGAYGLLWLRGADGDFLGIAKYLPSSMLPSSAAQVAEDDSASRSDASATSPAVGDGQESSLAAADQPAMEFDPAVAPATAEEPVADGTDNNSLGDILPQAPNTPPTVADPAVGQQNWPTTPIVGDLRGVKLYSVDELAELIPAADTAHREFLAGDLAREQSWSTMGPAYMTIASLAERYTLVDPAAQGPELVTKQIAAKNIFRGLLGKPERRVDVATVAARWLQHEKRLNQGVVLVGRVSELSPQGKWTQYTINIPLGGSFVPARVLLDRIQFSAGDEVAVVGAILQRPSEQLEGYEGEAKQVVVAGYSFVPEEFVSPQPGAVSGLFPFEASTGGQ